MKKIVGLISLLLLVLIIFPNISAVEFDMKANFSKGETFTAKVSGNFVEPVLEENVFFYRGHVRVSIVPSVAKINDDFYIYAPLPEVQNNYSIVIKNVKYYKGSQIVEDDLVRNFSTTENLADFSTDKGFVITEEGSFFIEVQNLQDHEIIITSKIGSSKTGGGGLFDSLFGGAENEVSEDGIILKSGEIKKINFELTNFTTQKIKIIELSTENLKYEIPVYIFGSATEPKKLRHLRFEPSDLNISMPTNSDTSRIIYIHNNGEEMLENISLLISDSLRQYMNFSIEEIDELKAGDKVKVELFFFSDNEEKLIEGQITAKANSTYAYSGILLNFVKDYIPSEEDEAATKTCPEMNGTICTKDEKCSVTPVYAKDDVCCIGDCKKTESSSTGKILGWTIIIAIVAFLAWFFKTKYHGTKRKKLKF